MDAAFALEVLDKAPYVSSVRDRKFYQAGWQSLRRSSFPCKDGREDVLLPLRPGRGKIGLHRRKSDGRAVGRYQMHADSGA